MDHDFKFFYNMRKYGSYHAVLPLGNDDINTITEIKEQLLEHLSEVHTEDDYHSTLMYSEVGKYIQPSSNIVYDAKIIGIDNFGGCLVLLLECQGLHTRHEELTYMGLKHSFEEYDPHITIGKVKEDTELPNIVLDYNIKLGNEYNEPLGD